VYRAEGTTQWYTAVIQSYNHTSKVRQQQGLYICACLMETLKHSL